MAFRLEGTAQGPHGAFEVQLVGDGLGHHAMEVAARRGPEMLLLLGRDDRERHGGQLIAGRIDSDLIAAHWNDVLRLATSIRTGIVPASLMLKRFGAYPRQNGLAHALREIGRIERTLFTLDWIEDPALRRQATTELNKGESKNALSRAVCFHRFGRLRDRSVESQRHRASGLNLAVAAIVLWNTVYLSRAIAALRAVGEEVPDALLGHLAPLGWQHINLTGDYLWNSPPCSRTASGRCARRTFSVCPLSEYSCPFYVATPTQTPINASGAAAIALTAAPPCATRSAGNEPAGPWSSLMQVGRLQRRCRCQWAAPGRIQGRFCFPCPTPAEIPESCIGRPSYRAQRAFP
jgi:hypothetical protein